MTKRGLQFLLKEVFLKIIIRVEALKITIWNFVGAHAREWISPATVTYIIRELVENRANYESFVSDVDFHIVPVLNVDGYHYSHSKNRMWRKNRRIIPGFCNGVDLNRNFGYKWGQSGAATINTCATNYAGKESFSEPESKAIRNYVSKFNVGYFQVNYFLII